MLNLSQSLEQIGRYADQNRFEGAPHGLYEPCNYILSLGGKRLRPALAIMAYELFADQPQRVMPVAWAVELFHNFSLIHDDIMDAAPLRRGKPTVHTRWNQTTAILSGDVMLIKAYQSLVRDADPKHIPALIEVFNRVAVGVCEGQQMDVDFESSDTVTLPEYLRMIELKTAVLLGGALQMGAIVGGAPESDQLLLDQFGRLTGVAFQIQDDLLDTYGDPEKFGKQVGGDILQNKKTYLVLKTIELAEEVDRVRLEALMRPENVLPPEDKIARVRAIFDRYEAARWVEAEKDAYEARALAALDAVDIPELRKTELRKMAAELLHRQV